jgi:UDP-N-acetylmuramyl pentapeptide phosphotransferase/UDP-N-acetylglucosamine-1-phosphate transferase
MRPIHIVIGAVIFGLGLIGIFDDYFVVIEFIKGAMQPVTALVGLVAVIAGMARLKPSPAHIVFGLILVSVGIYGFYDEYYAVLDFVKGAVPLAMVGGGSVAVVSGVNRLR